ncbi:unnamed protein product [Adineta steineri]|uniref:G domain-containing protein n=1 Tax=Adineta steineri TaxID=433720 RepID=A0A815NES0_9BILA|nr:unnamed protein product [Adineta steineri]
MYTESCSNSFHICAFCHEEMPESNMRYHLYLCGSKTNQCPNCQKYVQRAVYNFHLENNCINIDEDDYQIKSDTRIDEQIQDDESIPCEFCHKQIKFTHYDHHLKVCSGRQRSFDFERSIRDYSTDRQEATSASSNYNRFESIDTSLPDVVNTSMQNLNLNEKKTSKLEKATALFHTRTSSIRTSLSRDYFSTEVDHVVDNLQFNIILIGSPRVGKSQLINAICGEENLAETSPGLNSCTKEIKCYTLKDDQNRTPGIKPFQINFYDTPGIESWTNQTGQETMKKFIEEKNPICVIYCASPGSFADLTQLQPILQLCKDKQIFCALVCTNMWANAHRDIVIEDFKKQLTFFGQQEEKFFDQGYNRSPHQVTLFGNGALCTMINSIEYYDPDLSPIKKPIQGVDELIHCIMEELDQEKLLGWCNAVLYRRTFWEKIFQKTGGFFSRHFAYIQESFNANNPQNIFEIIKQLFNKNQSQNR